MSVQDKWEFDMPKYWDFTNSIPQKRPDESWFCKKNISGPSFPVQDTNNNNNNKPLKATKQSVFDRLSRETTIASTSKLAQHKHTIDKTRFNKNTIPNHPYTRPPHARKRLREDHETTQTTGNETEDLMKRFKTNNRSLTTTGLDSKDQKTVRPRRLLKGTVNSVESDHEQVPEPTLMSEEERRRLPEITIARAILARENLRQSIIKAKQREKTK